MDDWRDILVGWAMNGVWFMAWPIAAYVSARKIRHCSFADAFRFAVVVGVFFAVTGAVLATFLLPLWAERQSLVMAIQLGWVTLPFVLVSVETMVRRAAHRR